MQGKAHILFGITTGTITALALKNQDVPQIVCLLIGTIAGSVYPDIDNEESTISNRCPIISKPFRTFFTHRGFVHSLFNVFLLMSAYWLCNKYFPVLNTNFILAAIILYTIWKILKPRGIILKIICFLIIASFGEKLLPGTEYYVYGFFIGMIGHIFCDMFTFEGVNLFWPIKGFISFRRVKSGAPGEYLLVLAFGIIYFAILQFANIL